VHHNVTHENDYDSDESETVIRKIIKKKKDKKKKSKSKKKEKNDSYVDIEEKTE